jgi:hypothetical protein
VELYLNLAQLGCDNFKTLFYLDDSANSNVWLKPNFAELVLDNCEALALLG